MNTIQTPELALRPFVLADARRVFDMSQEAGMRAWLPDQVYRDEDHAAQVLTYLMAQYGAAPGPSPATAPWVLGVARRATGELIGHVGLSPCEGDAEIGYAIADAHQGHGYATAAVAALTAWGLQSAGLSRVLAVVASENLGSCRVLDKVGFTLASEQTQPLHGVEQLVRTYQIGRV